VIPVVSRVSGVADVVEEDVSGFLFPPGDEAAFAARLGEALSMTADCRRAMGKAACAAMHARFSLDAIAEQHMALYRKVIETGRCARA